MAGHSHSVLLGYRDHFLEEIGDALPVVLGADLARLAYGQILPVVLELEGGVGDSASSGSLLISPDRYDRPVVGDDLDADLGCLLNVPEDAVQLTVPLRTLAEGDIVGAHPDRFKIDAVLVAVVFHLLQFIRIPSAIRAVPYLRGEMLDAVAQVVLQVFLRRDAGTRHAMVVATHMHQGIFSGSTRRLRRGAGGGAGHGCADRKASAELSSLHHPIL